MGAPTFPRGNRLRAVACAHRPQARNRAPDAMRRTRATRARHSRAAPAFCAPHAPAARAPRVLARCARARRARRARACAARARRTRASRAWAARAPAAHAPAERARLNCHMRLPLGPTTSARAPCATRAPCARCSRDAPAVRARARRTHARAPHARAGRGRAPQLLYTAAGCNDNKPVHPARASGNPEGILKKSDGGRGASEEAGLPLDASATSGADPADTRATL